MIRRAILAAVLAWLAPPGALGQAYIPFPDSCPTPSLLIATQTTQSPGFQIGCIQLDPTVFVIDTSASLPVLTLSNAVLGWINWVPGSTPSSPPVAPAVTLLLQADKSLAVMDANGVITPITTGSPTPPQPAVNFSDFEVPAGAADGVNATLKVFHTPNPMFSLQLFVDGVLKAQRIDYILTGATIVFNVAPRMGAKISAYYRY